MPLVLNVIISRGCPDCEQVLAYCPLCNSLEHVRGRVGTTHPPVVDLSVAAVLFPVYGSGKARQLQRTSMRSARLSTHTRLSHSRFTPGFHQLVCMVRSSELLEDHHQHAASTPGPSQMSSAPRCLTPLPDVLSPLSLVCRDEALRDRPRTGKGE